jgi:hypothetical protein
VPGGLDAVLPYEAIGDTSVLAEVLRELKS